MAQYSAKNDYTKPVGDILADIQAITITTEKGNRFEQLFCELAPHIKELEIAEIGHYGHKAYLFSPDKPTADYGIDLEATLKSTEKVAIQCKCYAAGHNVSKQDIESFVAGAQPKKYDLRWIVITTDISHTAEKIIKDHDIKVINFNNYLDIQIPELQQAKPREPWPLQQEAIDRVERGFIETGANRGRLIMACGTGKTFTSLRIAEKICTTNALILFTAPSIALVAQARREFLTHTTSPLHCTIICSDTTTKRADTEDMNTTEISCTVTTKPKDIARRIKEPTNTAKVIFCTYQSLDKLCKAHQDYCLPPFDLAIIDEAHRTTGIMKEHTSNFQLIHNDANIEIKKRLYMTATERIYTKKDKEESATVIDMSNHEIYGPEFYRLTFKKAVEENMLCDYHVIALGIQEQTIDPSLKAHLLALNDDIGGRGKAADEQAFLSLVAISLAIHGIVKEKVMRPIARTIAYANNIRRSKWFEKAMQDQKIKVWVQDRHQEHDVSHPLPEVTIHHIDGTSTSFMRSQRLRALGDATTECPQIITNAKLFTEGIDVPALNAIAFLDPKNSQVETVQAVGRVMRKQSEKQQGYIIVPVILPENMNIIDTLTQEKGRFKTLGGVLRALQSHDERLETELNERLSVYEVPTETAAPQGEVDMPVEQLSLDLQQLYALIADNAGLSQKGTRIANAIVDAITHVGAIFQQESCASVIADTIHTASTDEKEVCRTAALFIINACIMHKRLEQTNNLKGLPRLEIATLTKSPISVLEGAWKQILEKDYAPIFSDAHALLHNLPQTTPIQNAIRMLIECANNEATALNDLGFDHAGPLYQKVLGTKKSDGAFYTKNISAYLLASLALHTAHNTTRDIKDLRILDPTCGTGTLLMAALNAIKTTTAEAHNLKKDDPSILDIHKRMVEENIYGFDINKTAIQLAACNLTIGSPDTDYNAINLFTLAHGPVDSDNPPTKDNVRHGALELLLNVAKHKAISLFEQTTPLPKIEGQTVMTDKNIDMPEHFDIVICNPPFTFSNEQGAKYGKQIQDAMRERLLLIKKALDQYDHTEGISEKSIAMTKAISKNSIQPYFQPLISHLLSENGVLAQVIPTTVLTAENGKNQRMYLAHTYHIDMIVTSHDVKNPGHSVGADISETLVIATKKTVFSNESTRFIRLNKYPKNIAETKTLIAAIVKGNADGLYTEALIPRETMQAGDWSVCQWLNQSIPPVIENIRALPNTTTCDTYPRSLSQQIRDVFDYDVKEVYTKDANIFCSISQDYMQTIQKYPTHKGAPKPGKEQLAQTLRKGNLLITTRFNTQITLVMAVYSPVPAVSTAHMTIQIDNDIAKAYVVFLNSTLGILQFLNHRAGTLAYPNFEASILSIIRLPDPQKIELSPLVSTFEEVKDIPLQRLRYATTDPARKKMDDAVAHIFDIPTKEVDTWRKWLSQEPTVNGGTEYNYTEGQHAK